MHSLILVPENFATEDYVSLKSFKEIRPYSLLYFEDSFAVLMRDSVKVLKELEKLLSRYHSGDIKKLNEEAFLKFYWKFEKFPIQSFSNLNSLLGDTIKDIRTEIKSLMSIPFEKDGFTYEFSEEEHMFIQLLYCACPVTCIKSFKTEYQAELIETLDNKALFKVYTLKSESEVVKKRLISKGYSILCPKLSKSDSKESRKDDILRLYYECHDVIIISALCRGMCEMLNKYNLSDQLKYKIIKKDKVEKEVKAIKKQFKGVIIEDITSVIDIEV